MYLRELSTRLNSSKCPLVCGTALSGNQSFPAYVERDIIYRFFSLLENIRWSEFHASFFFSLSKLYLTILRTFQLLGNYVPVCLFMLRCGFVLKVFDSLQLSLGIGLAPSKLLLLSKRLVMAIRRNPPLVCLPVLRFKARNCIGTCLLGWTLQKRRVYQ
ncbi:hypothetical protein ASPZODRAFT_1862476 [Penicilliopsis zonata CBS 506.65]|uniref:Uncharacterized protein n=1 Tax=Penicilliopsis zonata CBS 506.65 TaxID=1073090 RepID=A0A1L9SI98_9EURO|nr:hypothetical protein ASPZODRAFT_1862476 [Penicilliopsis zonata CBS 506.65]OJJ46952.1 hypothetical protein ASPZODRAFT_1862476 [Penicilliopsis zonata CBS 506.65]